MRFNLFSKGWRSQLTQQSFLLTALLIGLMSLSVKAQCTFTPTDIIIAYPEANCGTFGNVTVKPSPTQVNGAPTWLSITNTHQIKWVNSQWQVIYFGDILAINTTGSATNLPCSGWQSGPDDPGGCGLLTLSGGCGLLTAPTPPSVTITANPSLTVSNGSNVTLTASGAASYIWSANAASATSASVVVNAADIYSVTGTTSGCSGTATATVSLTTPAVSVSLVTAVSPGTVCINSSIALSVTAAGGTSPYTYSWTAPLGATITGNATLSAIAATATSPGKQTFTVTVTESGGELPDPVSFNRQARRAVNAGVTSTTTVDVMVNALPIVTITPSSTLIAGGQSATLTVSGASSYTWSPPSSSTSIVISPAGTTVYSVTGTDATGCKNQATATVSVTCSPPVAQAISATVTSVLGPGNCSVTIEGQGTGNSFVFTGPDNYVFSNVFRKTGTYSVKASGVKKTGTYTMTASSTNACGQVSTSVITFVVTGEACP